MSFHNHDTDDYNKRYGHPKKKEPVNQPHPEAKGEIRKEKWKLDLINILLACETLEEFKDKI